MYVMRRRAVLILSSALVAALLVAGGVWRYHTTLPNYRLRHGQEALLRGDVARAERMAELLESSGYADHAHLLRGQVYLHRHRLNQAILEYNQIRHEQEDILAEASLIYGLGFLAFYLAFPANAVGKGSQYAWAAVDAKGNALDGSKTYKLHLPPNIPVKDFWSLISYDNQTRSQLQTDQRFPMVSSQTKGLAINNDKSVDVYFGPKAPTGKENNWVQTIPGKGWNVLLRLYGPLEPWFDKTWRPGEIELVP
jgi:Protein of unknown function (DUF1214)